MQADYILFNGKIITLDESSRIETAVAIRGDRFISVGQLEEMESLSGPETRRINLNGRSVLPGFFDAHPHMDREGLRNYGGHSLSDVTSVVDVLNRVAEVSDRTPPGEWIVFMPMGAPPFNYVNSPSQLKEGRFPDRHDLDRVAPNNPVYIRNPWGWWCRPPYPAIANTAALRREGINRSTVDPFKIEIVRDSSGDPTGVFLERNRVPILEYTLFRNVPRFTYSDRLNSVRDGAAAYSALGTTSGYESHGLSPAIMRAYREADHEDSLSVRISAPISLPSSAKTRRELTDLLYQWAPAAAGRGMSSGNFQVSGLTIDSSDPNIAAPIARDYPYEQWASFFSQGITRSEFVEIGIEAAKLKYRLNTVLATFPPTHDTDQTLSMIEEIDRAASIRDLRCVGFHLNSVTPSQVKRIKALGLCVSFTPSFFYSQAEGLGLDKLGQDALPIRQLLDADIPIAIGSDNVPPSMLFSCWEALVRWDNVGQQHLGQSNLSREDALRICCQIPHHFTWEEDRRGRISTGRVADLVVLDGDPLLCEVDLLPQLQVCLTMLAGRVTYEMKKAV